jgi:hypothetical protein
MQHVLLPAARNHGSIDVMRASATPLAAWPSDKPLTCRFTGEASYRLFTAEVASPGAQHRADQRVYRSLPATGFTF